MNEEGEEQGPQDDDVEGNSSQLVDEGGDNEF